MLDQVGVLEWDGECPFDDTSISISTSHTSVHVDEPNGLIRTAIACNDKTIYIGTTTKTQAGSASKVVKIANLKGLRTLTWAGRGKTLCVIAGYENGLVRVITVPESNGVTEGKEYVLHGCRVQQVVFVEDMVWVLYEDKMVVRVPLMELITSPSWSDIDVAKLWRLKGFESIHGFAPFPVTSSTMIYQNPETMFSRDIVPNSHLIFVAGVRPAWGIYLTEGLNKPKLIHSLGGLVSAAATTFGSNVVSFARSWYSGGNRKSEQQKPRTEDEGNESNDDDDSRKLSRQPSTREKSLHMRHGIFDSTTRIVSNVNGLDPTRRYCITGDQLGRVCLIDTCGLRIIRIWKGYRDAQFGWVSAPEKWSGQWQKDASPNKKGVKIVKKSTAKLNSNSIQRYGHYLVIFAPWRQTVQIWRVPGCFLVSSFTLTGCEQSHIKLQSFRNHNGLATCYLMMQQGEDSKKTQQISLHQVVVDMASLERLYSLLNRGKDQHESFLVHQFRRSLSRSSVTRSLEVFTQADQIEPLWRLLHILDSFIPEPRNLTDSIHMEFVKHALKVGSKVLAELRSDNDDNGGDTATSSSSMDKLKDPTAPNLGIVKHKHSEVEAKQFCQVLEIRKVLIKLYSDLHVDPQTLIDIEDQSKLDEPSWLQGVENLYELPDFLITSQTASAMTLRGFITCYGGDFPRESPDSLTRINTTPNAKKDYYMQLPESKQLELAVLLYTPLVADVFSFPRVEAALKYLEIDLEAQSALFFKWWYSLKISHIVHTLNSPRNAVVRFLERFMAPLFIGEEDLNISNYDESDDDHDEDEDEENDGSSHEDGGTCDIFNKIPMLRTLENSLTNTQLMCHALALTSTISTILAGNLKKIESNENKGGLVESMKDFQSQLKELEAKLDEAVFLISQIGLAEEGLSISRLDDEKQVSFCELIAKAQVNGIDDGHMQLLKDRFPDQFSRGYDAIHCHYATLLAENHFQISNSLALSIRAIYSIKQAETRGGLAIRLWNTFGVEMIQKILDRGLDMGEGKLNAMDCCDEAQELLQFIRNAHTESEANRKDGKYVDPLEMCKQETSEMWPPTGNQYALTCCEEFVSAKLDLARLQTENTALMALKALLMVEAKPPLHSVLNQLFPKTNNLFENSAFMTRENQESKAQDVPDQELLLSRRMQLVQRTLRADPHTSAVSFDLAQAFQLPLDKVRQELCSIFYSKGLDTQGEKILGQVSDQESLALMLLAVARGRMAAIMKGMQSNPKYRHLLAVTSADTSRWIRAAAVQTEAEERPSSLSSTLILLRKIQDMIPTDNPAQKRAIQMTRAADALWRRVQELR